MAMVVDAFGGKLVERLINLAEEKAILVLGVKTELHKLRRRMEKITRVLKDAERRRIQDPAINAWVTELKDFMYDADDLIDLCLIQGSKLLADQPSKSYDLNFQFKFPFFPCCHSVPLRYEIASRVKRLSGRLEEISKDKESFNLVEYKLNTLDVVSQVGSQHSSDSLPEPDVVGWGIRDATRKLVELLVCEGEQKCRFFAIVGMGGIGKTTLAQIVYDNYSIQDSFILRSWVSVSKHCSSEVELLKVIIRNIGGSYGDVTTTGELKLILRSELVGKSFFLVLDDVWQANVWVDLLKNTIQSAAAKVGILVTTRDENIAKKMGAVHMHNVSKLPVDSGWELLCKKVFVNRDGAEMHKLRDIGIQIVTKCDGLPLAIKTIAGVLIMKNPTTREWEKVLNSDAWTVGGLPEELQGALYLSYEDLPCALKHCFLHCSLIPPDRALRRIDLAYEWIAEGYVQAKGNVSLEEVADEYYMELIRRSFLQPDLNDDYLSECTMHELLRTLAQFLACDESFSGDPQEANSNSSMTKLRRLSISSSREIVGLPPVIVKQNCLRTLMLFSTPPSLDMHILGRLSYLRVLILNGKKIGGVPDNIGEFIHLRLLDLKFTGIHELPDSIGSLTSLEFLNLEDCESLHTIPESIAKLCNLRCLRLKGTPLSHVPKGIGKLEHLSYLNGFVIGSGGDGERPQEGHNLEELQSLKNLRILHISSLEMALSGASVLSNKPHLRQLMLHCTVRNTIQLHTVQETNRIEQVFDKLSPPSSLEKLVIDGFFGSRYPKWMSSTMISTSLIDLTILHLMNCISCPQLPPLGQLPELNYLKVGNASAIVSIGSEFFGSGVKDGNGKPQTAFPSLEYLIFDDMPNLEEWSFSGQNSEESSKMVTFGHLRQVSLHICPKLKALPRGLNQVNMHRLYIEGAHSLTTVENFPNLTEWLQVINNHRLAQVSNLPALRALIVRDCPMLQCVEKLDSLLRLQLIDTMSSSLPEWLITFLRERQQAHDDWFQLDLDCTVQALKGFIKGCPGWSILEQVPQVVAYAENKSKYLLYTKEPFSYKTNLED